MRTLLIFLALCACASAQPFAPLQYHRTASAAATPPTDSCKLRWKASSIAGKSSGDTVGIMPTIIPGGARNVYQLTASAKPVYYADSINGKPAVRFDGVNDIAQFDKLEQWTAKATVVIIGRSSKPRTNTVLVETSTNAATTAAALGVYTKGTDSSTIVLLQSAGSSGPYNIVYGRTEIGLANFYTIGDFDRSRAGLLEEQTTTNGNSSSYYGAGYSQDFGGTFTAYDTYIGMRSSGSASPFAGLIAEILVYTTSYREWSAADKTALTNYLSQEYGL